MFCTYTDKMISRLIGLEEGKILWDKPTIEATRWGSRAQMLL